MKKKISWWVIVTGAIVGLSAVLLTHFGNPANMGFCIACFLRDIAGSLGLHSAGKVQYVRPEIIGLVLGAFVMSVCTKEFRAKSGSAPALRFVLGAFVMIGALAFLGCPLRMVLRLAGSGNGDSTVTVFGMLAGAAAAHNFGLAGTADSTNAAGEFVRGGLSNTGKIAVVSGIVVCLAVSVLNLPKFAKKQEAK